MYTWEIDDLVRARGNILPVQEYIQVCRSPQVDHVKRDGDRVKIWTRDGGFWEIEIKKQDSEGLETGSLFVRRRTGRRKKIMMKAMLIQPMAGKTDEEIIATREKAIKALETKGYEIVNTLFTDEWYSDVKMKERGVVQIPLCFLAKSLENMSLCHAAYFCKGWENARGCRIEHEAAKAYGLEIIYENQLCDIAQEGEYDYEHEWN